MDINRPNVVGEIEAAFEDHESALISNDVDTLQALFWRQPQTICHGTNEILHGWEEIGVFRPARSHVGLTRSLSRTVKTPFRQDCAIAWTQFCCVASRGKTGRQMQTWIHMPEGWQIVAAHVSSIDEPTGAKHDRV